MKGKLVSNYRENILAKISNLTSDKSLTIKNMTDMDMIISLVDKNSFCMDIINCLAIYKPITINRKNIEYYIGLYQNAMTEAETYNVYLLASKELKVGSSIEILNKNGSKTIGIISSPNKQYYGIYYKVKNHFLELNDIDSLLDNTSTWNVLNNN